MKITISFEEKSTIALGLDTLAYMSNRDGMPKQVNHEEIFELGLCVKLVEAVRQYKELEEACAKDSGQPTM